MYFFAIINIFNDVGFGVSKNKRKSYVEKVCGLWCFHQFDDISSKNSLFEKQLVKKVFLLSYMEFNIKKPVILAAPADSGGGSNSIIWLARVPGVSKSPFFSAGGSELIYNNSRI